MLVAPPTLLPVGVAGWPVTVSYDLDAELPAADAVLMLRVQAERMNGGFFPSTRGLDLRCATGCPTGARRCFPAMRLSCIPGRCSAAWKYRHRWLIRRNQRCCNKVSNGVHVRMAVLFHLLVGTESPAEGSAGK